MCELMTIAAAAAFTLWHFALSRRGRRSDAVFAAMLMFWGAALMWGVDCVANALDGEPLLDLSWHDAKLGAIVVLSGLAVCACLTVFGRRNEKVR